MLPLRRDGAPRAPLTPASPVGRLLARQSNSSNSGTANPGQGTTAAIVVCILFIVAVAASVIIYVSARASRARKNSQHYIPGDGLVAALRRWTGRGRSRGEYSTQLQPTASAPSLIRARRDDGTSRERSPEHSIDRSGIEDPERGLAGSDNSTSAGIDRNTSVRSIMTLPAYSPAARDSEQILGREGERAGIDVVIEYPETVEEEEARRDDEMESLFQIRQARRQEQAEREQRRRQRRDARSRGDVNTLNRLQAESRLRAENSSLLSQQLIAEHQNADRQRRVSKVQYAAVGVARHDGTRVHAGSIESDSRPLLESAASISGSSIRPTTASRSLHSRGQSTSSLLSVSTSASDEMSSRPPTQHTNSGDTEEYEVISLDNRSRTSSVGRQTPVPRDFDGVAGGDGDLGDQHIPAEDPPRYDDGWGDAPPYESPTAIRAPQLPLPTALQLSSLPSIEIQVTSPVSNSASRTVAASRTAAASRTVSASPARKLGSVGVEHGTRRR